MERKNKMKKDSLGDRMKQYEGIPRISLMRRNPVIIRIDGKAFHTFTRGFQCPFDDILIESMQETMKYLCENIQGCKLGYCQSDEISLLITDYENINTAAWFDYQVQKMCSITASMATLAFNRFFRNNALVKVTITDAYFKNKESYSGDWEKDRLLKEPYLDACTKGAMFDARCFSIPKEEVCNYFQWRQMDYVRNSIQMVGQANFSHKELQNKKNEDIQEMLFSQKGINWNDFSTVKKRGSCCVKDFEKKVINFQTQEEVTRKIWGIDKNIPIFSQDRNYIERFV
jgi:tRNA(His) 5'-end guanylyltransferase